MPKSNAKLSVGFLFDDTLDSNDGVAQYVKTIGTWLSGQGHEVSYLVGESKTQEWAGGRVYSLAKNIKVIFNGNRLSMPLPAARKPIKQLLAEKHFDVLHVQVPYSPFMSQVVINSAKPSTAVVGTFHVFPASWLPRAGSKALRILYGSSLQRVRPMLAVSPPAANFAKSAFGLQTEISPNVVELKRFAAGKPIKKAGGPQIVFLGRLVNRKGCRQLLEAFMRLQKKIPNAQLIIAGDGPERASLQAFARRQQIQDKVSFLGFIDEKDKPGLLAGADIACFPSLKGESFGIVLIEAMAAGAGVVLGGDNPGYRSVLGSQPQLLIDSNNAQAFADRLEKILTDEKLAAQLHAWQKSEVKRYDVAVVGPQLLAIYRQAIANRQPTRHN